MVRNRQKKRTPKAWAAAGSGVKGPAPRGDGWRGHLRDLAICGLLAAAALAVFGRTVAFPFVAYDDNSYVYENRHVRAGLSLAGVDWSFTRVHAANWHPLTTLSHMLDCSLFGLHAWGHHLSNVLLHAAATAAVFLALRRMTRMVWRSAIVAAAFCLHPLHVESVAWVAERKDVLSGLFFGLTLWAYSGVSPISGSRGERVGGR